MLKTFFHISYCLLGQNDSVKMQKEVLPNFKYFYPFDSCALLILSSNCPVPKNLSNEVGMSLVPDNKLGRLYRDLLGKANQHIAKHSDEVYFLVAGIPLKIKGTKHQYNLAGDIDD